MKSTSCELALKPSLYNNNPIIHTLIISSGEQPSSALLQSRPGEAPTFRASHVSPGEITHIPRTSVSPKVCTHFGHRSQPRWLSGLRRSRVHSVMIVRRSVCPETLGSNPGQGSKGINFSGWHGLDMSVTVTKRR